jgi:hypothetical protein
VSGVGESRVPSGQSAAEQTDDAVEWIEPPALLPLPRGARARRVAITLAAVLLLGAILLATQPILHDALWPAPRRAAGGQLQVQTNVAWARLSVDGHPQAPFVVDDLGAPPQLVVTLDPGRHRITLDAEGFVPQRQEVDIIAGRTVEVVPTLVPSAVGKAAMLAATDALLRAPYYTTISYAVAGAGLDLRPPVADTVAVREQFDAVALDPTEPLYLLPHFPRALAPLHGAIGVAVVAVERAVLIDTLTGQMLAWRQIPIGRGAAVLVSVIYAHGRWQAAAPYLLNPQATIYTEASLDVFPATPGNLVELAARDQLDEALGHQGLLAGAACAAPVAAVSVSPGAWSAGLALWLRVQQPRPGVAVWFYRAGALTAVAGPATGFTPGLRLADAATTALATRTVADHATGLCR